MTKKEIQKVIAEKKELVRKLEVYQITKGDTLPTGKDVIQSIVALQKQIEQHEYDLEYGSVLSDDEVIALARGKEYLNPTEKAKAEEDRKYIKDLIGEYSEDEIKEIQEMIKVGR